MSHTIDFALDGPFWVHFRYQLLSLSSFDRWCGWIKWLAQVRDATGVILRRPESTRRNYPKFCGSFFLLVAYMILYLGHNVSTNTESRQAKTEQPEGRGNQLCLPTDQIDLALDVSTGERSLRRVGEVETAEEVRAMVARSIP